MNADKTNGLSALIRVHPRPGILYDPHGRLRERGESQPRPIGTARAHQHRGAAGASTGHRIDIPISHHEAPLRLDAELAHRPQQQPRGGLAAVAGGRGRVRAVVDARDGDAKRRGPEVSLSCKEYWRNIRMAVLKFCFPTLKFTNS